MRQLMVDLSALRDILVFRVNVGTGWTSSSKPIRYPNGDMLLRKARPFHTGLPKGFHDVLVFRKITITADMVGQDIAQVVTVETKTKIGRPTKEQLGFQKAVTAVGGLSLIARPDDDTIGLIDDRSLRTNDT